MCVDTYITWYFENNRPADGELELYIIVVRQQKEIYHYPEICDRIV
jgi:hypothetical protein